MNDIFGQETTSTIQQKFSKISPSFVSFLQETFSDMYSDNSILDLKTKEIIVITTLITQKDAKPQLKLHIKAALTAGVTKNEILALIQHLALYIGFPTTINALLTAQEAFDEIG
ncbi:MAG: 4-carboxymuconolactone decarboxylase [Pseudomonadota bacterium]|nr:4-carboxymuconolactone decarboxylase [Pseudomonadota bacterium]